MAKAHPTIKALLHPNRLKTFTNTRELTIVEKLPTAYQNFYKRWRNEEEAAPVHWIARKERFERTEKGVVRPVQNAPIPVLYPHQQDEGIWGGEGVVKGLVKKRKYTRPVPRFWVPKLKETVVYSEVLDKYLAVVVTERALRLIDEKSGFDNYILSTPENDVKSVLALKIKRRILLALAEKDFAHDNPTKQEELCEKYKQYIIPKEDAEWVGLTLHEAVAKHQQMEKAQKLAEIVPLKFDLRRKFIEQSIIEKQQSLSTKEDKSVLSKLKSPFSKSEQQPSP